MNMLKIIAALIFLCCVLLNANLLAQNRNDEYYTESEYNRCSNLTLKQNGDTISTAFCVKFRLHEYSFQSDYLDNRPMFLMIYYNGVKDNKLVAEFMYDKWEKNKWIRHDYHTKSVPYRKQLLKKYLKTKGTIQYEHVQIKPY